MHQYAASGTTLICLLCRFDFVSSKTLTRMLACVVKRCIKCFFFFSAPVNCSPSVNYCFRE